MYLDPKLIWYLRIQELFGSGSTQVKIALDPNWAKIQDPDPNSIYLDPQYYNPANCAKYCPNSLLTWSRCPAPPGTLTATRRTAWRRYRPDRSRSSRWSQPGWSPKISSVLVRFLTAKTVQSPDGNTQFHLAVIINRAILWIVCISNLLSNL